MAFDRKKFPNKIEDMSEEEIQKLEEQLRPDKESLGGFLGGKKV